MKNIIYLKSLEDTHEVLKDGVVKFTSKFEVKFNNEYTGLMNQYKTRLFKYLKTGICDNADKNTGIFTLTKFAKCSEEDTFDETIGIRISRAKVEIAACNAASKLLGKLHELMISDTMLLSEEVVDVDIRKACEEKFLIDNALEND